MSAITTSTEVSRPAAEVFAYATDPSRFHEWQKGVVEGHMDATGPQNVGDRCVTTRRVGFANRLATAEITHIDPPRTWGVRGVDGPVRATVELVVEWLATDRSRLTISVDFEGHGVGRLLVPLVVCRQARREMPENVAALKQHLELEASPQTP
jgi:uncharacterized protein YndB with AHSA1/START domain